MDTLFGMRVHTSAAVKPVPVLQLSPTFTHCSESFRVEMNQWLLDMFGTKEVAYMIGNSSLVMSLDTLNVLNREMIAKGWL